MYRKSTATRHLPQASDLAWTCVGLLAWLGGCREHQRERTSRFGDHLHRLTTLDMVYILSACSFAPYCTFCAIQVTMICPFQHVIAIQVRPRFPAVEPGNLFRRVNPMLAQGAARWLPFKPPPLPQFLVQLWYVVIPQFSQYSCTLFPIIMRRICC